MNVSVSTSTVPQRALAGVIADISLRIVALRDHAVTYDDVCIVQWLSEVYDSCLVAWKRTAGQFASVDPIAFKIEWDTLYEAPSKRIPSRKRLNRKLSRYCTLLAEDIHGASRELAHVIVRSAASDIVNAELQQQFHYAM